MFHYRLAPANNRSRMFIAVLLAIALHLGVINFEFKPKPLSVPSVSLPRSVTIFLRQSSIVETPEQSDKKAHDVRPVKEEQLQAEIKQKTPVLQEVFAAIIEAETFLQSPPLLEETVKQTTHIVEKKSKPAIKKNMPAYQEAEDFKVEADEAAKTESQALQKKEEAILPGTIQVAYPRYQLNEPPAYPALARKRDQEGTVTLQVLVNREGRVDDLKVDVPSNFALLDRAALSAVKKWSFEPGRRGKEMVPMWVRVPVTFKLKK